MSLSIILYIVVGIFFLIGLFSKDSTSTRKIKQPILKEKEDLKNSINNILKLISKINSKNNIIYECKEFFKKLNDKIDSPALVTVLGEFSSGKSTFINALIKETLLAMKIRPTTATITRLQYNDARKMCAHFKDGKIQSYKLSKDELHNLTVENKMKENDILNNLFYVQLELENELLKNIDIADTPGFNSGVARHSEITAEFIKQSDVIFWIFDATKMGKKTEFDTLQKYCRQFRPIIIVNRIDEISNDDNKKPEEILKNAINKIDGFYDKIFFVSSKKALDNNTYNESNIQNVIDYFNKEIIPNSNNTKFQITTLKIIERINQIYNELNKELNDLEIALNNYKEKNKQLDHLIELWNKSIDNWNSSLDKEYEFLLKNLSNYFLVSGLDKNFDAKAKDYVYEINSLYRDFDKINQWYNKIVNDKNSLDSFFNNLQSQYDTYSNRYLGFKSFLDSLFGDFTEEKKKINRKIDQYENMRAAYNEDVDSYNNFLNLTNNNAKSLNKAINEFLNKTILKSINEQKKVVDNFQKEVKKQEPEVKKIIKKYESKQADIEIITKDVYSEIRKIIENCKISFFNNNIISDFNSLVQEANQHIDKQKSTLNWENIYTRKQIDNIIKKQKESESLQKGTYQSAAKESRTKAKIQ
ncbi:MAG TPA: dynamin family protein [bacterium]|nr:dynamin family protein [bacterium]